MIDTKRSENADKLNMIKTKIYRSPQPSSSTTDS